MEQPPTSSPFAVLGLDPTLELGRVKRAYFAKLGEHSPHADPEGFRRVRAAYEALCAPGGLQRAYASAPLDVASMVAASRSRFDGALAAAGASASSQAATERRRWHFVETVSRLSWADAKRLG